MPRTSRNASQPNATPDAPIVVPGLPVSHTPRPLKIQIVAVTAIHGPIPPDIARKPNSKTGSVFANRCAQLACRSGAQMIPSRPLSVRGWMPNWSSRPDMATSTSSMR